MTATGATAVVGTSMSVAQRRHSLAYQCLNYVLRMRMRIRIRMNSKILVTARAVGARSSCPYSVVSRVMMKMMMMVMMRLMRMMMLQVNYTLQRNTTGCLQIQYTVAAAVAAAAVTVVIIAQCLCHIGHGAHHLEPRIIIRFIQAIARAQLPALTVHPQILTLFFTLHLNH